MVKFVICGGGNGAHCYAGIASSQPGVDARVLTLYADEAERWTNSMKTNDFVVTQTMENKSVVTLKTKPTIVTKDPAQAAPGADIFVFMMPAFAHQQYLLALKEHVKPGAILVGLPGQAGFEFEVRKHWGDLAKQCTLVNFESLPWACRLTKFGETAEVIGTKTSLMGAIFPGTVPPSGDATAMLQSTLGPHPQLIVKGHLLAMTLMGVNAYIHPSIMYGVWSTWDGNPLDEAPLFYQGMTELGCATLDGCSNEILATAKSITQQRPNVDLSSVIHIYDWYIRCYAKDMADTSNLYNAIRTNGAYKGLKHPCKQNDAGKYLPDFAYRYMTEDMPCGLVVMKGIALVAGVPTPTMDKVIEWAQSKMGAEYLVNGQLSGKDVAKSRSPQAYGIQDLDTMLGLK